MTGHFLSRDVRDFVLWWMAVATATILFVASAVLFGHRDMWLLWVIYYFFAFCVAPHVLGSVWRTQHQWSRQYLLALPISHWRLFGIQHVRILMFWLPLLLLSAVAPAMAQADWRRFTTTDWWLYYFGLPVSIGLLIEMQIWTALDMERITTYVPRRQRVSAWVKSMTLTLGVIGLLAVAWSDLLFPRTLARGSQHFGLFTLLAYTYWPGCSYVLFPAAFLLSVLWARHNARRWCVTL